MDCAIQLSLALEAEKTKLSCLEESEYSQAIHQSKLEYEKKQKELEDNEIIVNI